MPDPTDPTEDMVKREIAAAVEILKSDAYLKHSKDTSERLARLEARFGGDGSGNTGDPTPPPPKDPPKEPAASKKRGLWWGDALQEPDPPK